MRMFLVLMIGCWALPCWGNEGSEELFNFFQKQEEALVVKTANSDVIVLENGQRVKLIGIESIGLPPKKYAQRDKNGFIIEEKEEPTIPLEEQALMYAQDLLEGKKVKLEYDIESSNREGYHWAYVYLPDGRMANCELLRMGFVRLSIVPPNIKHADALRAAYQEAKREKRGLQGE